MEYTRETVLDVTLRLFGDEYFAQAIAILKEYAPDLKGTWLLLSILRASNGKLERLRTYVRMAQEDFRDVYLVGTGRRCFRVEVMAPDEMPNEELTQAEDKAEAEDRAEFVAWVEGRERRLLCETCGGFGITSFKLTSVAWDFGWKECQVCKGTGYS